VLGHGETIDEADARAKGNIPDLPPRPTFHAEGMTVMRRGEVYLYMLLKIFRQVVREVRFRRKFRLANFRTYAYAFGFGLFLLLLSVLMIILP